MRFSIFLILAIITIVSVVVYGYRLNSQIETTQQQIETLQKELAQFPPNLERNLKLMRSAQGLTDPYEESVEQIRQAFEKEMQSRAFPEDFQATTAMACNTMDYTQEERPPVEFQFYCPRDRAYTLEIKRFKNIDSDLFKDLVKDPESFISFTKPIKIELPGGISKLVVTTKNLYSQNPTEVRFVLDGNEVAMVSCNQLFNAGNDYNFSGFYLSSTIYNQHRVAVDEQPVLIAQALKQNISDRDPEKRNVKFGIQCWLRPSQTKEANQ